MERSDDIVVLAFTYEEAHELFARCLRAPEEDNEASASALRKLGTVIQAARPPRAQAS